VSELAYKAWSLLSLTETEQGPSAYPNELGVCYIYDTTVPNGRHIAPGDLAIVRDDTLVLGAGWIDSIDTVPGRKIRPRCPTCGRAGRRPRKKLQPKYRCPHCSAEFDDAIEEEVDVKVFNANYSRTWRPADALFPEEVLDPAYATRSKQNAIRRLDVVRLRPILDNYLVTGEPWWGSYVRKDTRIRGGSAVALVKTRLGQQRFREAMLGRYGEICAFTGPQPAGALEAAHLYLYSENPTHDIEGGLLLRCDLHALFDRWLITIDPERWSIEIGPDLRRYSSLAALHGQLVQIPPELRPRERYVRSHAIVAHAMWNGRKSVRGHA
jgi:hypothetical protein